MKYKRLLFIPLVMVIVTIIASIISFVQDDKLEQGFLHSENSMEETVYDGGYFAVIGNLKTTSFITTENTTNGILIKLLDENALTIETYTYRIFEEGSTYDSSIITMTPVTESAIDDLEDYLFEATLEANTRYTIELDTSNGNQEDPIDVVLIALDNQAYLTKQAMESIMYISGTLSILSLVIIVLIIKLKQD